MHGNVVRCLKDVMGSTDCQLSSLKGLRENLTEGKDWKA